MPSCYNQTVLKTKQKIALAGALWYVIRLGYRLFHVSPQGLYRRARLTWNLDLEEGIDFAIFLFGHFEPGTVRFYQERIRPGDVILDIGANVGAHTLPLAQCVSPSGRVHAFEPTDFAFRKLLVNVSLNPDLTELIVANHMFLSANDGQHAPAAIYSSWPLLTTTEDAHPKHLGQLKATSGATTQTLDRYCLERGIDRVDWIKLDVDGNEFTVLQGAGQLLSSFKPKLLMELSPYVSEEAGHSFADFMNYLFSFGYTVYDLRNNDPLPSDPAKLEALVGDGASINVYLK